MTPLEVEMAEAIKWILEDSALLGNRASVKHARQVLARFHTINNREINETCSKAVSSDGQTGNGQRSLDFDTTFSDL
jgi:hypothetical protein